MTNWIIEYKRSWPIYTFRLRPVSKGLLPSASVLRGSSYWAWTVEGVKRKALRECKLLDTFGDEWKVLSDEYAA